MTTQDEYEPSAVARPPQRSATAPNPPTQSPTLLPAPVAQAVSLATRSTSLALALGTFIGSNSLYAARVTTLSSLELARGLFEGVLVRAAGDTALIRPGSKSKYAEAEADATLDWSFVGLHQAMSQAVFWTAASFQLTDTAITTATGFSHALLSSLDQLFGSTDSSRAIATIIALIRKEYRNPATGLPGEKVGFRDLLLAFSALACLQKWCLKTEEEQARREACEEVIWDLVVLADGERVDVPGQVGFGSPALMAKAGGSDALLRDEERDFVNLRSQIQSALPSGTKLSITSSTSTTQTVIVEIDGPRPTDLPVLPGAEVIESSNIFPGPSTLERIGNKRASAGYRVVYRIEKNRLHQIANSDDEMSSRVSTPGMSDDEAVPPKRGARFIFESEDSGDSSPNSPSITPQNVAKSLPPLPGNSTARKPQQTTKYLHEKLPPKTTQKRASGQEAETSANQKRPRTPLHPKPSKSNVDSKAKIPPKTSEAKHPGSAKSQTMPTTVKPQEKKGGIKQVLKGSGQSLSNIWTKENANSQSRPTWKGPAARPPQDRSATSARYPNIASRRGSQSPTALHQPEPFPRSSSRASSVAARDVRRSSVVSHQDAHHGALFPVSPGVGPGDPWDRKQMAGYRAGHRRAGSHAPSIYSMATNDSQTSLVLSAYYQKSAYRSTDAIETLRREGFVDGTFPSGHLLQNICRYMRFSSASYGSNFLNFMGISKKSSITRPKDKVEHPDVRHFAHHTSSGNILLASFVDDGGGSDSSGSTESGMPLVHYISLDHDAKAVVFSCRGTLGFEDVLTDLTCDYDSLVWKGRGYTVHKGMHASARRLLYGGDGRVLVTLREALEDFPDYGLVLCGHSLGAAVTSLLGVMLAEPNPNGIGFVTRGHKHARIVSSTADEPAMASSPEINLPSGRRMHVYAYGSPGVMSTSLSRVTRGLITSVVHGSDLVPHLSLGALHDFQAVALAVKKEDNPTRAEIKKRMWSTIQDNMAGRWYNTLSGGSSTGIDNDDWMLPALDSLRENMNHEKLLPPGEVFVITSQRVLRRDAFRLRDEEHIGHPAHRIVLKYVKDVAARFGELRFEASMLLDHSPAKYETALDRLRQGLGE